MNNATVYVTPYYFIDHDIDILEGIEYRKIKYIHNKIWIVSGYVFSPDMAALLKLKYPDLEFEPHDEQSEVITDKVINFTFQLYDDPSEDLLLDTVKETAFAIKHIKNPSEKVQLAAVQQDGWSIQFIDNPSEAVQLAAVQQDGYSIQWIDNPSEAVQLAAVQQHGFSISVITNPFPSVQLEFFKKTS